MARSKNLQYLLRMPIVLLPFFYACASGTGKPAASADDADSKTDSSETTPADDASGDSSKKSDSAADETSDKKEDAKSDKKTAAKGDDDEGDAEAAPKDDSRTTEICRKVIDDNRKAFKKCYKDLPDIKGTVVLELELDAGGKIKKAYIDDESTIKEKKVHDCILDLAKSLTYPKSTKGLDKNFEYTFGIRNG